MTKRAEVTFEFTEMADGMLYTGKKGEWNYVEGRVRGLGGEVHSHFFEEIVVWPKLAN